jgi:mRNA interferase RelE/StbE
MQVEFLAKFNTDLDKVKLQPVKDMLTKLIHKVESAETLSEIPNVKKLVGYTNAYRIRVGDYRVGIFLQGNTVQFARVVHRKDIYKVFP